MQEIVNGNPKIRKPLYATYAVVGVILGATQVGFAAAEAGQPTALTVALAVYAFLGGAFGFGARSKVDAQPIEPAHVGAVNVIDADGGVIARAVDDRIAEHETRRRAFEG